jgi:phosphoribosylanthranilate isomerase
MPKVKICGITNLDDAKIACEAGADFIGFVFVEGTPRCIDADSVKEIIRQLPKELKSKVGRVGLFVKKDIGLVTGIVSHCDLDHIQLHGSGSSDYCKQLKDKLRDIGRDDCKIIKTIRIKEDMPTSVFKEYDSADFFLFDTYHESIPGGTGEKFNWDLLRGLDIDKPFFLAGGLTPENVAEAVKTVKPYAVDVSSGVEEKPGKKDAKKVKEFIDNARNAG